MTQESEIPTEFTTVPRRPAMKHLPITLFLFALLLALCSGNVPAALHAATPQHPNFVLILGEGLGLLR